MPLAVLKHGVIHPVEPLPSDWKDGTELVVEKSAPSSSNGTNSPTDEWMDKVEALANAINPSDDERLTEAVATIRKQDREAAHRKRIGLNAAVCGKTE